MEEIEDSHFDDRCSHFPDLGAQLSFQIMSGKFYLCTIIFLSAWLIAMSKDFLHQRPDQHKSYPGWQEPGLWRPKWVLERDFPATETSKAYKDRLYIKLKPDRTIDIINSRKRPLLQIFKGRSTRQDADKKTLFETGTESSTNSSPNGALQESIYEAEGTWAFTDESPMPTARVILETRERQQDGSLSRIRHECRCEWGKTDDYAAKFRRGKLFKYKGVQRGSDIPLGKYAAGTFILRANAQRPLVSKEFQAFQ